MLALKSTAAVFLAALMLVITPTFLHQDAGSGKADDVAQLLPEGTLGFVELVRAPRILHDWKDYVGSVTTPEGKTKACTFIEEWFTQALEIIPEKILKDLKEGLPSIQRIAVALTASPDPDVPWILVATSSDPAFFKKLVEQDLAVFAGEEKSHEGTKVLAIRKLGDLKSDFPFYVAAAGGRLLLTTRWASMTDALDRAAGKVAGSDLRKNRMYAKFSTPASEDPVLRGFSNWDWEAMFGGSFGGGNRRTARMQMDQANAAFEFHKMGGAILEATFKPGKVESTLRMPVDSPCRLYDAFRQPPGPKDLLAQLPKKTVLYAHHNLKGGKEVWADLEVFIRRFQETERKANPGRGGERDFVEELNTGMKREMGITPLDLAAAVGNEVLFALVDPGEAGGPPHMFLGLFRTTDAEALRKLMEAVSKTVEGFTKTEEDGLTLYSAKAGELPCFGVRDTVAAIGMSEAIVRETLRSKEDAAGAVKRLPKEAATASGVLGVNPAALVDMILRMTGTEKPDALKHLRPDDWSTVMSRTEKDQATITTIDSGYGAVIETAITAAPIAILGVGMVFRGAMVEAGDMPPVADKPVVREPEPLSAEELAKRTADLVPKLRSDELDVREKATADLRALGRQAAPRLIDAFKAEKDPEAKNRLTQLLVEFKAWDALPELLDHKVDAFFEEFRVAIDGLDEHEWGGFSVWHYLDMTESFGLEPYVFDTFLAQFKNADVLAIPNGMKRLAERLKKSDLVPVKRAHFASLLAFHDCGSAGPLVLELRDAATDAASRAYLTAALGWSDDGRIREAVYRSLESKEASIRRGAFLAAERMRDPEIVGRLLDRTKDETFEVRWNACFTLGSLTGGKMSMNAFLPDAEYDAQIQAARKWWDANRTSFKLKSTKSK